MSTFKINSFPLIPVADQMFYAEEVYDPNHMFFTEGEQMFYPDEMGYYPGEDQFYPGGIDNAHEMAYPDEMYYGDVNPDETYYGDVNPDETYYGDVNPDETYYGDVAEPIPIQSVMGPSGSLQHTYYGDDQDEELSDDNA